jgi:hypothetical protein
VTAAEIRLHGTVRRWVELCERHPRKLRRLIGAPRGKHAVRSAATIARMTATLALAQFNVDLDQSPQFVFGLLMAVQIAIVVFTIVIHIACALAVFHDAMKLGTRTRANPTPTSTVLVGALVWSGGTLLLGLVGLALYWLVHHSTLRAGRADDAVATRAAEPAPIG